jgi:uncharacterized protein YyaL (SSP411 family)
VVFARLHELTGEARWKERGAALVAAFAGRAAELGLHAATYLLAVDWQLNPATHLVVVGDLRSPATQAMHRASLSGFVPRRLVQLVDRGQAARQILPAAIRGMLDGGDSPRGYACTGATCSQPAGDLATWELTLESVRSAGQQEQESLAADERR